MKILAIETSCDETAAAVLEISGKREAPKIKILSNIVASQVKIHAPWGGVVPNLAKREHQKNLPVVLRKALKQANFSLKNPRIDLMAVTSGPGLEPALWVGINFAQDLAKKWNKPLIGINHLEGHIASVLLKQNRGISKSNPPAGGQIPKILFPALALVVSGGHTELVLIKNWLKYQILGQTLDDAAGEAFDKVAKMLGLGYPGGPIVSQMAGKFKSQISNLKSKLQIKLPRPMINSKDYNFSFSGLKTAVLYLLKDLKQNSNYSLLVTRYGLLQSICHEFQQAVIDVLVKKTMRATKDYRVKTIILGGGVVANKELRKQMMEAAQSLQKFQLKKMRIKDDRNYGVSFSSISSLSPILLLPEIKYSGDNAAMIALAAYFRALKRKTRQLAGGDADGIVADSNLQL